VANPFDDTESAFRVLVNHQGHHSLWPDFASIPPGWTSKYGPASREACLKFVEENWHDMRISDLPRASRPSQ